jgi:hypothetical protein
MLILISVIRRVSFKLQIFLFSLSLISTKLHNLMGNSSEFYALCDTSALSWFSHDDGMEKMKRMQSYILCFASEPLSEYRVFSIIEDICSAKDTY